MKVGSYGSDFGKIKDLSASAELSVYQYIHAIKSIRPKIK